MAATLRPSAGEPHDPLTPRPDDPSIGRWWWARRLYARGEGERPLFFRWPVLLAAAMLLLGLAALAVFSLIWPH